MKFSMKVEFLEKTSQNLVLKTSYATFNRHNMVHCGYIPIGSKAIRNDIAKSFILDLSTAKRIKIINGLALF